MGSTVGVMAPMVSVAHSEADLKVLKEIFVLLTGVESAKQVRLRKLVEIVELMNIRDSPFDLFVIEEEHDLDNEFVPWPTFLQLIPMLTTEYRELKRRLKTSLSFYGDAFEDNTPRAEERESYSVYEPPRFPMYVMRIVDFLDSSMNQLPSFEDALHKNLLWEVEERLVHPGQYFVHKTSITGQREDAIRTNANNEQIHLARHHASMAGSTPLMSRHIHSERSSSSKFSSKGVGGMSICATVSSDVEDEVDTSKSHRMIFHRNNFVFVSHQWLSSSSSSSSSSTSSGAEGDVVADEVCRKPDDTTNSKFLALKKYFQQYLDAEQQKHPSALLQHFFVWLDYFSVPQSTTGDLMDSMNPSVALTDPETPSLLSPGAQNPSNNNLNKGNGQQMNAHDSAVASLASYLLYCGTTVVTVPSVNDFTDRSKGFASRFFCAMELMGCKLPRKDIHDKWYVPGSFRRDSCGRAVLLCMDSGESRDITWDDIMTVLSGTKAKANANDTDADDSPGQELLDLHRLQCTEVSDRSLLNPLFSAYLTAYQDFYDGYLVKVKLCHAWKDLCMIRQELLPQTFGIESKFVHNTRASFTIVEEDTSPAMELVDSEGHVVEQMLPVEWANQVLPIKYIDLLRNAAKLAQLHVSFDDLNAKQETQQSFLLF